MVVRRTKWDAFSKWESETLPKKDVRNTALMHLIPGYTLYHVGQVSKRRHDRAGLSRRERGLSYTLEIFPVTLGGEALKVWAYYELVKFVVDKLS
ncbi:MAG: hypothetical protein KKF68_03660 [Nanoarchaeota archaeon]|nr:hypothetical protein [Nanoarchaeota archaeon]